MSTVYDAKRLATAIAVLIILVGSMAIITLSHNRPAQDTWAPSSPSTPSVPGHAYTGVEQTEVETPGAGGATQTTTRPAWAPGPDEAGVLSRIGVVVNTTEELQRIIQLAQSASMAKMQVQVGRLVTTVTPTAIPLATPAPPPVPAVEVVDIAVERPVPLGKVTGAGITYSVTNVQVWGIDEPDIVKTNGTRIFIAVPPKGLVYVVSPIPPDDMRLVKVLNVTGFVCEKAGPTTIIVKDGNTSIVHSVWPRVVIQGLHVLDDGRLVVLVREERYMVTVEPIRPSPALVVPPLPVTRSYTWVIVYRDGVPESYVRVSGSLVDSRLYNKTLIVVTGQPVRDNKTMPLVNGAPVPPGHLVVTGLPLEHYTTILLMDLETMKYNSYSLVGPRPKLVYMSPEWSLYIVLETAVYRIQRIIGILEAQTNRTITVPPLPPPATTLIVKLSIDPGRLGIADAGRIAVEGLVRKQWQLDEYNGTLRLAIEEFGKDPTTGRVGVKVVVHIYNATSMDIISTLEVRLDENIHGVRFLGDRLYIVTFRRVDPLFAIDLSDPYKPRIIGYLEGPGFDEYLHPLNKTALIGIGVEEGYIRVSTYRIHDDGSIELVARERIARGYTPLFDPLFGHRVFVLDPIHNLILFPAIVFDKGSESGIIVVGFDPVTLELSPKGLLVHRNVLRTLFIDDAIYSVSFESIRSYSAITLEQLDELRLPP